ncbi:hypothetical protein BANRA_05563 [Klebsiella pneumoniae]|nr:hypothetical protein BANRA_05563 [Klebsiella pneumoniae]
MNNDWIKIRYNILINSKYLFCSLLIASTGHNQMIKAII